MKPTSTGLPRPQRSPQSRADNPPQVPPQNTSLRTGQGSPAANVPANPAPADAQAPAAHAQPAINPGTGNLASAGGDLSNPVLKMPNPFAPGFVPPAGNPFATANTGVPPTAIPAQAQAPAGQGPAPGENPFDWLDKVQGSGRYAGFTADGQVVPRIFGQTNSPAPQNNGPVAGGPSPAPQNVPFQAPPGPVPNGAPPPPAQPFHPQPHPGPATPPDTLSPFFDQPDAGLTPLNLPPTLSATPTAAETAKAQVKQRTEMSVFCLEMHDLVLAACLRQGLSPSIAKPFLDYFMDHSLAAFQEAQKTAVSNGLVDNAAPPLDAQAFKASLLARRADTQKTFDLQQQLKKKPADDEAQSTFDPRTRKQGNRPAPLQRSDVEQYASLFSADSDSNSGTGSISKQLIDSYDKITGPKAPGPKSSSSTISIDNSDADVDDADEAGSGDDDAPIGTPPPVATPSASPMKKLSTDLFVQRAKDMEALEKQLKATSDPATKKQLLLNAKKPQDDLIKRTENECGLLQMKQPATQQEQARIAELLVRNEAAVKHADAIETLARINQIDLRW